MDGKHNVGRKKLARKSEPSSKSGIRWPRWTGFRGMTVREWLQLLVVPLALVVISLLFAAQQDQRQQKIEDQRATQAQKIENQRAEAERELAKQSAQDEALQAYLDQMSSLLLKKDLRASDEDSEVRTLARARTLTVLETLDPFRKAAVMQFLVEAELVQRVEGTGPIIKLTGADLRNTDVQVANLSGANLDSADLTNADLDSANLTNADLDSADLEDASVVTAALSNADLSYADLTDADLYSTDLTDADLHYAHLSNTDLSDADLRGANLRRAWGWTEGQLGIAALDGATMPNGQKYEDWLIDIGQRHTTKFKPALSYSIRDDWQFWGETTDELFLGGQEGGLVQGGLAPATQLIFTSPSRVFDPSNSSDPTKVSAPENVDEWVSWFQRHPNLDTSKPVSVRVGGATGMRIDATLSSKLEDYPRDFCGKQPCVPLYPKMRSTKGYKDRFIILDVKGETVIIDVSAPSAENKFDELWPKAQKVLDTVEWKSQ